MMNEVHKTNPDMVHTSILSFLHLILSPLGSPQLLP